MANGSKPILTQDNIVKIIALIILGVALITAILKNANSTLIYVLLVLIGGLAGYTLSPGTPTGQKVSNFFRAMAKRIHNKHVSRN